MPNNAGEKTYFELRMEQLGVTPDLNRITVVNPDADPPGDQPHQRPIFETDQEGNIHILVTTVGGELINYTKMGKGKMSHINAKELTYKIIRYATPRTTAKGDTLKYQIPAGQPALPFFPPNLQEKYKNKTDIDTLWLTEGYLKAYKGDMHGMDIIGLASITTIKDKHTNKIYSDIARVINECNVKRVVFLQDGDCLTPLKGEDLREAVDEETGAVAKVFANEKDLYKRPNIFFNAVRQFGELFKDFDKVQKYFSHIKSREIEQELKIEAKGLDDLLIAMPGREAEVVADSKKWSEDNTYFFKSDISFNVYRVHKYFKLNDVTEFYQFHNERGLKIGTRPFVFNGTQYVFNEEEQKCKIIIPGDANRFFRVGDQYYEKITIPNKHGQKEKTFQMRMKSTITDDFGKMIIKHINKYKAFCNVPDHVNYQEVIYNCYNLYFPFEHAADEGNGFDTIEKFLKHIFGTNDITWRHPKLKTTVKINEYDLGLDYIQLLYQQPAQILPILCLVSKENNTGKSTLGKFFRYMFGQNVAIVGNADLANDFNAFWAPKLLVICDETRIDKLAVVEKIKNLSTADKVWMNAKGKNHVEIDFFAKFMFITNNEENFIYASEEDVRYWVRKIPSITKDDLNVDMLKDMQEELPAFLDFLSKRKMATDKCHRAWFDPELIRTDALKKVIAYSRPTIEKEIREHIRDMFFEFQVTEITMSGKNVRQELFKNKYELNYVRKVLSEDLRVPKFKDETGAEIVTRYTYPRWEEDKSDRDAQERSMRRVDVQDHGRPYVFSASQFLTTEELAQLEKLIASNGGGVVAKIEKNEQGVLTLSQTPPETEDDLPF